jgi:hypothetical protein
VSGQRVGAGEVITIFYLCNDIRGGRGRGSRGLLSLVPIRGCPLRFWRRRSLGRPIFSKAVGAGWAQGLRF